MRVLNEIMLDQPDAVRLAFLEVLSWILHADGVVDPREQQFLDHAAAMLGFESLQDALREVDRRWKPAWTDILAPVGPYVLMQGALLAWSDGELHESERAVLERLRDGLQVERDLHDKILRWAYEGHRWTMAGLSLLARADVS